MAAEFTSAATLFPFTAQHHQEPLFSKSHPRKVSRRLGEANAPMQSVGPILHAPGAQRKPPGFPLIFQLRRGSPWAGAESDARRSWTPRRGWPPSEG